MKKLKFLILFIFIFCFLYFGNNSIQTSPIEVYNSKIPKEFDGYTIVQVSDLHNKKFGNNQSHLINKIKNENPNIIVVTGDLIYKRNFNTKYVIEFVNRAVNIAPIYYVVGNHEAQISNYNFKELHNELANLGVIILKNEHIKLNINNSYINLFGINDPNMYYVYKGNNYNIVNNILSKIEIDYSKYNILLSHRPDLIELYSSYGYDLVFTGHVHGGQIRIPFLGGIWAPDQGFLPKYTNGSYVCKNTTMIVSRGLGKSIIPFRIFNRPEIIVCKLKKG